MVYVLDVRRTIQFGRALNQGHLRHEKQKQGHMPHATPGAATVYVQSQMLPCTVVKIQRLHYDSETLRLDTYMYIHTRMWR
jgi:hypothetical protein